jgi:hypothetical protein
MRANDAAQLHGIHMSRIYDYYGSQEPDIDRVRNLITDSTGPSFTRRDSSYIGEYYLANGEEGEELTIRPNDLEDEEGHFLRWPEHSAQQ